MSDTITLTLVQSGKSTVTVDRADYEQAKADDMLDHFLDAHASGIETETVVIEPDGTEVNLYE